MRSVKSLIFSIFGTVLLLSSLIFATGFTWVPKTLDFKALAQAIVTETTKFKIVTSEKQNTVIQNQPSDNQNQPSSNQNPSVSNKYRVNVSIANQTVQVYQGNTLIKNFLISTGTDNSTPKGDFTIQNRGEWFYSNQYQEGAKWWVSFKGWGTYLFHTVPMDRNQQIIQSEANKLGTPASHGCIRMAVNDAKWFYDNIPQGTPVHIE
jgi:lipoprotein-anchoring transpeptidase ErfK/SrfK